MFKNEANLNMNMTIFLCGAVERRLFLRQSNLLSSSRLLGLEHGGVNGSPSSSNKPCFSSLSISLRYHLRMPPLPSSSGQISRMDSRSSSRDQAAVLYLQVACNLMYHSSKSSSCSIPWGFNLSSSNGSKTKLRGRRSQRRFTLQRLQHQR